MNFIPHTLAGIPCLIRVSSYVSVGPWRGCITSCPSSDDYYGYTDMEYELFDRKGYRARWLDKKLTPLEKDRIEQAINDYYSQEEEP